MTTPVERLAVFVVLLTWLTLAGCGSAEDRSSHSPTPRPKRSDGAGYPERPVPHYTDVMDPPSSSSSTPPGARTDYPTPPFSRLAGLFAYDPDEPLDFRMHAVTRNAEVTLFDISYRSMGRRVRAWLVLPARSRPVPAVLYAHGYAGSRDEFLGEAHNQLGPMGYAGLLIDTQQNLWTFDVAQNSRAWITIVTDLRRGIDLLETLPQVDVGRLGFVGIRQGADAGAILSGVDDRVRVYSLISSAGYLNRSSQFDGPGVARPEGGALERFLARMFSFSPALFVAHAQADAFLFMNSTTDPVYPRPYARALFKAAEGSKQLRWYRAGHDLDAATYEFQDRWLSRRLQAAEP